MEGCQQSWGDPRQLVRTIAHVVGQPCHGDVSDEIWDKCVQEGKRLSIECCLAEESDTEEETEFAKEIKMTGIAQKTLRVNKAALDFICANSLPPTLVDTKTWKALITSLDSAVRMYSSSKLVGVAIPARAIELNAKSKKILKKDENLTVTCDGCTIRSVQSIYTVHATRPGPGRESYLLAGDEASGHSHTSEHVKEVILKVHVQIYIHKGLICSPLDSEQTMKSIGLTKFSALSTDSTSSMKVACDLIAEECPYLLILPDICHLLNNMVKDIVKLDYFSEVTHLS